MIERTINYLKESHDFALAFAVLVAILWIATILTVVVNIV